VLEVEYAQALAAGSTTQPPTRERLQRSQKRGWMFVLGTDASGAVWQGPSVERLQQQFRTAAEPASLGVFLSQLIHTAHRRHRLASLVGCAVRFDRVVVARMGSAYCYVLRNDCATLLTLDRVEVTDYELRAGDILMLCNESLVRTIRGSQIAEIARRSADLGEVATQLANTANGPVTAIRILHVQGKHPSLQRIARGTSAR
jgi:hypothetical protein